MQQLYERALLTQAAKKSKSWKQKNRTEPIVFTAIFSLSFILFSLLGDGWGREREGRCQFTGAIFQTVTIVFFKETWRTKMGPIDFKVL